MTARITGASGLVSPAFAAPVGTSTANASEAVVQTLSPARAITAASLAVRTTVAPGAGNSITVTLRDDGADTALACTIADTATSCSNVAANPAIGAGSALSLAVTATLGVPTTALLVGLETK